MSARDLIKMPTSSSGCFESTLWHRGKRISLILVGTVLLSGCSVRDPHESPEVKAPEEWSFSHEDTYHVKDTTIRMGNESDLSPGDHLKQGAWWQRFNDPVLTQLVDQAIKDNYSSQQALARIEHAQGYLESVHGSRLPQVEASSKFDRSSMSVSNPTSSRRSKLTSLFEAEIGVSWELDLFEKLKNEEQAAFKTLEAQEWARRALNLILVADVCTSYFKIRTLSLALDLMEDICKERALELSLVESQYEVGLVDGTKVLKSQMNLEGANKRRFAIHQSLHHNFTVLSLLTTRPLSGLKTTMERESHHLPTDLPLVVLDRFAKVVQKRPDLQEAQSELAASYALTTAAMASFYPSISLSGVFGYIDSSRSVGQLAYGGGIGALLPLLNFGVLEGRLSQAQAAEKQALLSFQEGMLKAFLEIEQTVTKFLEAKAQVALSAQLVAQRQDIFALSQDRVDVGLESQEVLSGETVALLEERMEALNVHQSFLEGYIQLMKALGE